MQRNPVASLHIASPDHSNLEQTACESHISHITEARIGTQLDEVECFTRTQPRLAGWPPTPSNSSAKFFQTIGSVSCSLSMRLAETGGVRLRVIHIIRSTRGKTMARYVPITTSDGRAILVEVDTEEISFE